VIRLNGYCERWFAGAGALGFDGYDGGHPPLVKLWKAPFRATGLLDPTRFTVISKTVTAESRVGRQTNWGFHKYAWPVFPLKYRSMVNAVALSNPGIDEWIRYYYPIACRKGIRIALSLHVESVEEALSMGAKCNKLKSLCAVQINASCPNLPGHASAALPPEEEAAEFTKIIDAFQSKYHGALLVKFRLGQPWELMAESLEGRCAGYELINAVPYPLARTFNKSDGGRGAADGPSPLAKYGYDGSLSGGRISLAARIALDRYIKLGLKTPAISGGGVVSHVFPLADEVQFRLDSKASAVAFSTAFLWEPWGANRVVAAIEKRLKVERETRIGGFVNYS